MKSNLLKLAANDQFDKVLEKLINHFEAQDDWDGLSDTTLISIRLKRFVKEKKKVHSQPKIWNYLY